MTREIAFFLGGFSIVLLTGVASLWFVRRDTKKSGQLTAFTVAIVWFHYLLHFGLVCVAALLGYWPMPLPHMLLLSLGAILTISGFLLLILALLSFKSFRRMSGMDTSRLITSGVYKWSRNPQNVGWALVLVGVSLVGNSMLALSLAILFWVMFVAYVPEEEALLARLYGDEYRRYVRNTARYLSISPLTNELSQRR